MHPFPTTSIALLFATAATAQVIYPLPRRGIMPAYPAGLIRTIGGEIEKKEAGVLPVSLVPFDRSGPFRHYQVDKIMAWLEDRAQGQVEWLQIDAMSSGNDALPLIHDASGEFWISQGNAGWAVLHLAIEGDPTLGDVVIGYYFDNPSFPQQLRNGIYHELLADELGGGLPVAMDVSMGLLEDNGGQLVATSDPVADRIYFSLTPQSALQLWNDLALAPLTDVDDQPYSPPTLPGHHTGATIFVAVFNRALGTCSGVHVCEDWESLALPVGADIDALAVGAMQPGLPLGQGQVGLEPGTRQYVFSTDAPVNGEELLAAARLNNQGPGPLTRGPLRGNGGDVIVGGSVLGKVRATCAEDPEVGNLGGSATGAPENHPATPTPALSMSLAMRLLGPRLVDDQFEVTGVLSGWAGGTPQDSMVWLFMQMVGGPLDGHQVQFNLPNRSSNEDVYQFKKKIQLPWLGTGAVSNMNRYRFWVGQLGLTHANVSATFPDLVLRKQ
jgi:hypothetical protein